MRGSGAFRTSVAPGGALAGPWVRNPLWRNARAVPSLDLDFAGLKSLKDGISNQDLITFTRASSATYVGSDGLIKSATTNEPRFDHNPTTGESLGLLVEEAVTNYIRNNTMVGAVAGTPGTLPTNWSGATTVDGLTREIIGTGTQNGISYIDVRFSGTSGTGGSTVLVTFDSLTQAAASTGQTWTPSIYLSIANGSATNISTLTIRHRYYNAVGTPLTSSDTIILTSLSSVLQRFNGTAFTATDALTAYTMFLLNVDFVNSSPVDITIRIGLPQLEQGAFATSPILTSTATVTRAADVAQITGSNFSSWYRQDEGTFYADTNLLAGVTSTNRFVFEVNDGVASTGDKWDLSRTGGSAYRTQVRDGGVSNSDQTISTSANPLRIAVAADSSAVFTSANGTATSSAVKFPTGFPTVDRLFVGGGIDGSTLQTNGHIRRLTFWPTRLANTTLQQITQ